MIGPFNRYYRYDTDSCSDTGFKPYLREFTVVKSTQRGAWIRYYDKLKLVINGEGKRFAHATKESALKSYIARKNRQLSILSYQLDYETICRDVAREMLKSNEFDYNEFLNRNPFWMMQNDKAL